MHSALAWALGLELFFLVLRFLFPFCPFVLLFQCICSFDLFVCFLLWLVVWFLSRISSDRNASRREKVIVERFKVKQHVWAAGCTVSHHNVWLYSTDPQLPPSVHSLHWWVFSSTVKGAWRGGLLSSDSLPEVSGLALPACRQQHGKPCASSGTFHKIK